MELMHNSLFRLLDPTCAGLYRVVLVEKGLQQVIAVRLDPTPDENKNRGGRKKLETTKRPRKKPRQPMVSRPIWFDIDDLERWEKAELLVVLEEEPEMLDLSERAKKAFDRRKSVMANFLDFDQLRDSLLAFKGIGRLVKEATEIGMVSKSYVRQCFSLLARFGFIENSLRPRLDRCGAPGVSRPCDQGSRQKAGRKTTRQRIAKAFSGIFPPPDQPGMNSLWKKLILAADKLIPKPKPAMPERCIRIVSGAFVKRYKQEGGKLVEVEPEKGTYPNNRQIRRVLEREIPRLERLLQRTTQGHFDRSMRGLRGRSWQGVSGPGHTWAIDSTIGDIYLRSSVNRAWIIGRPIVYIIVDVWSTAVVGFYVCLEGPSWAMAKISLFCSAAPTALTTDLWGFPTDLGLSPEPTMCAVLMCDRGEYLSKAAKFTGAKLIPCLSYAPPYRPDLKGLVEVLNRIKKDRMYFFVPGAIDYRRKEFELRQSKPDEAVLTLREFVAYLYIIFLEYNLTAPRHHRLDAHMHAAGVFPSPAGLWRFGHQVGIGVQRYLSQTDLITYLLPEVEARVTRHGVRFAGRDYASEIIHERQWTAHARNFGGRDIQAHHFPGTVSRIWTPDLGGKGLIDLRLEDTSTASPELTFDEVNDAYTYSTIFNADIEHANNVAYLNSLRQRNELVENAKRLTGEALAKANGAAPSFKEARAMERESAQPKTSPPPSPEAITEEAEAAHAAMMKSILSAMNHKD